MITFRDGPTGRRAGLVNGPDVWEVVRPSGIPALVAAIAAVIDGPLDDRLVHLAPVVR